MSSVHICSPSTIIDSSQLCGGRCLPESLGGGGKTSEIPRLSRPDLNKNFYCDKTPLICAAHPVLNNSRIMDLDPHAGIPTAPAGCGFNFSNVAFKSVVLQDALYHISFSIKRWIAQPSFPGLSVRFLSG